MENVKDFIIKKWEKLYRISMLESLIYKKQKTILDCIYFVFSMK